MPLWLLGTAALLLAAAPALAQVRSSTNYAIQVDGIYSSGGTSTSTNYTQRAFIGDPFAAPPMVGTNYSNQSGIEAAISAASPAAGLTVTNAGGGAVTSVPAGINCGTTCAANFTQGSLVTLTATPAGGSVFGGWSGCHAVSGNQCTVEVNVATGVSATFTASPSSASAAVQFALLNHTVVVRGDGSLWAWGYNEFGQVGDGTLENRPAPTQVGTATSWTRVAAGAYHTVALRSDGTLWTWGRNNFGQLGAPGLDRSTPAQMGAATDWTAVAAGFWHTMALKSDGTLWAWGHNGNGRLGDAGGDRSSPTQVGTATNWAAVAAGYNHTVALRSDGTLWAWGYNAYGQIGNGTTADQFSPLQIGTATNWTAVSAGGRHTVALKSDGTLWAWGGNIGSAPVQVGAATNWMAIAGGGDHTVALKSDGTLWAWGTNGDGQLGDGSTTTRPDPVQIGAATDWTAVAAGEFHSGALNGNGELLLWGWNGYGQLGDGTTATHTSPTQVTVEAPDTTAPSVPAGVTATVASSAQINVSWTAASDNVAVTLYRVYRDGVLQGSVAASTLIFNDTGLAPSTAYNYTVAACDAAGNCSEQSAPPAQGTTSALLPVSLPFRDDFTGAYSASWQIRNPQPANISTSSSPGALTFNTTATDLWDGTSDAINVFSVPVAAGVDLTVTAKLSFPTPPDANSQQGGIIIFGNAGGQPDVNNWIRAAYGYIVGARGVATASQQAANPAETTLALDASTVWLRIIKSGANYTTAYSTDGVTFTNHIVDRPMTFAGDVLHVGMYAINGPTAAASIPVAYDYFEVADNATPRGVIAALSGNNIVINWSAVTGATGYKVYMANQAGVTKANYASLAGGHVHDLTGNTATTYTHASAAPGTYYLVVTALGASGESAESPEVSITVPAGDSEAPSVPQNLAAAAVNSTRIDLAWSASTDNVAVTAYQLFRGGVFRASVNAPSASFSDTGLTASTLYDYTVAACDAAGNCSAPSGAASATTPAATGTATLLHWYTFNSDVSDVVGTANGTLFNGASASGGVLNLGSTNGYVEFGEHIVPVSGSYTVAFFARLDSLVNRHIEFISQGATGGPGFYIGHDPALIIRVADTWISTGIPVPSDGQFHHYAVVVDAASNSTALFIDGVIRGSIGTAVTSTSDGTHTRFGRQYSPFDEFAPATLADVRIYGGALSDGEVAALVPTPSGTYTANLELGFNLIANSLDITINVPATFGNQDAQVTGVTSNILTVWKWNAVDARWAFHSPQLSAAASAAYAASRGYDVLTAINPGEGYWVNSVAPVALPAQTGTPFNWSPATFANLPTGFNLIAQAVAVTPSQFNINVSQTPPAPGVIPTDNFVSLWVWDAAAGNWYFYSPLLEASGGLAAVKAYADSQNFLHFQDTGKTLGIGTGFWVNRP